MKCIFLIFALLIICTTSLPLYRVDLKWNNRNNTVNLHKGKYEPITIEIYSAYGNNETKHEKTTLSILDKERFIMPYDSYEIDTNEVLAIRTFIGLNCNALITEEEQANGIIIQFEADNSLFETQAITVFVLEEQNYIFLDNSDNSIGPQTYGIIHLVNASMNTNPFTIHVEVANEQYKEMILFDKTDLVIEPSVDATEYYKQYIKYYYNGNDIEEDINNIQIKVTINDEYYAIHNESEIFEINIIHNETISDIDKSNLTITWILQEQMLYFLSIDNGNIANGMLYCAIVARDLEMVSNEDILSQIPSTNTSYQHKLHFINGFIGNKQKYIKIPITNIDKYQKYKWKCLYENNAYDTEYKKRKEIESTGYINAVITNYIGMPSCWNAIFTQYTTSHDIFDSNIKQFISYHTFEDSRNDYNEDGCLRIYNRNISSYYKYENKTPISYCLYSDPLCNITSYDWESISNTVNDNLTQLLNNKTSIEQQLQLSDIEVENVFQTDYIPMNASMIHIAKDIRHNEHEFITQINTIHDNPIECYYNVEIFTGSKPEMFIFNKSNHIIIQPSNKENTNLNLTLPNYDNHNYAVIFLCNSLPGWELLDKTDNSFISFYIYHSNETEYDCEKDIKTKFCIGSTFTRQVYDDLKTSINGINNVIKDIETFKSKIFSQKESSLNSAMSNMDKRSDHHLIYPYVIKANEYMSLMDCIDSDNYMECIEMKKENSQYAINKVKSVIYNDSSSVANYVKDFNTSYARDIYEQLLIIAISLGNNADAFNNQTTHLAFEFLDSLIRESNSILNYIDKLYKDDNDYNNFTNDIGVLYMRTYYSMQVLITYMDIQDYFSKKTSNDTQYIITDNIMKNYVKYLSLRLSNIFIKTKMDDSIENEYFIYKYKSLTQTTRTENVQVNDIVSAVIPNNNDITGITFITYKSYPLISIMCNTTTFGKVVVNINTVNDNKVNEKELKELDKPIDLIYDLKKLEMNITHCYMMKDGNIIENGIKIKDYNEKNQTVTCEVSQTGDVIVTAVKIDIAIKLDESILPIWVFVLIGVGIVLIIIVCVYCIMGRKKKAVLNIDTIDSEKLTGELGNI